MKTKIFTSLLLSLWSLLIPPIVSAQCTECVEEVNGPSGAQTQCDNFENYSNGTNLSNGPNWSVWPAGNNYYPISAVITNTIAFNSVKSAKFQYVSTPVDMLYDLGLAQGFKVAFKINIPVGKSAILSIIPDNTNITLYTINFKADGNADIYYKYIGSNGVLRKTVQYPQGSWFRVNQIFRSMIPAAATQTEIFFNDALVDEFVFNDQGFEQVRYLNLYAQNPSDLFYIDNVCVVNIYNGFVNCTNEILQMCIGKSKNVNSNSCRLREMGYVDIEIKSGPCNASNCNPTPINCGNYISSTTRGEKNRWFRPDYHNCLPQDGKQDFLQPDKLFSFTKTNSTDDIHIHLLGKNPGIDLDIFLLDKCDSWINSDPTLHVISNAPPNGTPGINCIAKGISTNEPGNSNLDDDYIFVKDLPAGTYYIVVDGQYATGDFDLSLVCGDLDCAGAKPISCNQKLSNETNSGGNNKVAIYCDLKEQPSGSTDVLPPGSGCYGPEKVYSFNVTQNNSPVVIKMKNLNASKDLEMFLVQGCSHLKCIASSTKYRTDEIISANLNAGIYYIVIDGFKGDIGTYDLEVTCCPDNRTRCYASGPVRHYYSGNGTDLTFTFLSNETVPPGYQWQIKTQSGQVLLANGGSASSLTYTFPSCNKYEVCFPRLDPSTGCVQYCCYFVDACNPFNCNEILYNYNDNLNSFLFDFPGSGTHEASEWIMENPGNSPVLLSNGRFPLPGGFCESRTISYRYYDKSCFCWRLCCIRIWICNPFDCLIFGYRFDNNSQGYIFNLNASGATNITWKDDTGGIDIGTGPVSNPVPPNGGCVDKVITAKYFWNNRWYLCCQRIRICDPKQCQDQIITQINTDGTVTLSINSNSADIKWFDQITGQQIGSGSTIYKKFPYGSNQEICLYYRMGNVYYTCCKKFGVVVGTVTEDLNLLIDMHPNPVTDVLTIYSELFKDKETRIQIANAQGIIFYADSKKPDTGTMKLSTKQLNPGMYFIIIETEKGSFSKRFIKL